MVEQLKAYKQCLGNFKNSKRGLANVFNTLQGSVEWRGIDWKGIFYTADKSNYYFW